MDFFFESSLNAGTRSPSREQPAWKGRASGRAAFSIEFRQASDQLDPPPLKWSDLKYVSRHQGGLLCRRNDTSRKRIVAKLRQVDVLASQGVPIADAVRSIGVTEVTYYRWRREYGGLKSDQVKRLKALETENARLRKAISDLTLDKLILQEAARGNF